MWNPFKKEVDQFQPQVATIYDDELSTLDDYYGSTAKALAELLYSKGVPVVWSYTMLFANQWVSFDSNYNVEVERDSGNRSHKYHWIKKREVKEIL